MAGLVAQIQQAKGNNEIATDSKICHETPPKNKLGSGS
jgi:hypothetical protein